MSRPILSRPRTRVYGCNYDKGESYYKPMVDHLDRKYSGRPLFPESRTSIADEIAARRSDIGTRGLAESRNNSFDDLDLMYDYRGRPITEENYEEDFVGAHRRFKERAAAAFDEDLAELRRKRKDIQDRMFDMVDMDAEIERAKATLGAADLAFGRHAAKFDNNEVPELTDDASMLQKIQRSRQMKQADVDEKSMTKSAPFKWSRVAQMEEDPYELKSVKARKARINSLIAENATTDDYYEIDEPKPKSRSSGKSDKRKKSVGF